MEKRKKTAVESGVLILIVAAILVAVNALSALGMYARSDVTKSREVHALEGQRELAALDEAAAHRRRLRHQGSAQARRVRPRSPRPLAGVQERRRREVRLRDHRAEGRGHEEEGEGRGPHRAAVRRGERHRREGRRRPGLHGPGLQVRRAAGRHQVLAARSHRRPRVLDHEQDPRDSRQGRRHPPQDRRPDRPRRDQAVGQRSSCPARWASTRCSGSSRRTSRSTRSRTWT